MGPVFYLMIYRHIQRRKDSHGYKCFLSRKKVGTQKKRTYIFKEAGAWEIIRMTTRYLERTVFWHSKKYVCMANCAHSLMIFINSYANAFR